MILREKKAKHLFGFEPTTSGFFPSATIAALFSNSLAAGAAVSWKKRRALIGSEVIKNLHMRTFVNFVKGKLICFNTNV